MKRTQSTPAQRHVPPAKPQTVVRTVTIPSAIIAPIAFGCMLLAIIAALAGAFAR
jgi:hypothetical protein